MRSCHADARRFIGVTAASAFCALLAPLVVPSAALAQVHFNSGADKQKYHADHIEIPIYVYSGDYWRSADGTVTISDGSKVLCTFAINGRGTHTPTCSPSLAPGRYVLTATYAGAPSNATRTIDVEVEPAVAGQEHHMAAPPTAACKLEGSDRIGAQSPRNILMGSGSAPAVALPATTTPYNLCNLHFHKGAEHMSPLAPTGNLPLGFSIAAPGGGYQCDRTSYLTAAQLTEPVRPAGKKKCENVRAGDTIEVHWVFSSCDVNPGRNLGACTKEGQTCALRVESQVFTLVNDASAKRFSSFSPEAKAKTPIANVTLPDGERVVYRGSTTNPAYNTSDKCSPASVMWGVRKQCELLDVSSLHDWCEENEKESSPFSGQKEGHDPRGLVTRLELLSPISSGDSSWNPK